MGHAIETLLDRDHAVLLELGRELGQCTRPALARLLFRQFAAALGGHVTALRKVVYPALGSAGWSDTRSGLLAGDGHFTRAFAELLTLKPETGAFAEVLPDVLKATRALIERERAELLPLLREHLDDAQRLNLALEAEPYLVHARADEHGLRPQAADWIEEARLLLGGLLAPPIP